MVSRAVVFGTVTFCYCSREVLDSLAGAGSCTGAVFSPPSGCRDVGYVILGQTVSVSMISIALVGQRPDVALQG